MKTFMEKLYRLVEAKNFFSTHGHETSKFSPTESLTTLYHSLTESRLRYFNTVWGNCGTSFKNKLQRLQDGAARIVTKCDDINNLLHKLGWLCISQFQA